MNFNTIPVNGGTWEEISNLLDYNFCAIQSQIPRVFLHRPGSFKGLFTDLSEAEDSIKNPADGTFFFLVSEEETGPFTIYSALDGEWIEYASPTQPVVLDKYLVPNIIDSYELKSLLGLDIKFDYLSSGSVVDTSAFGSELLIIPWGINKFRINANGVKIDDNLVIPGDYRYKTYTELVENPEVTFSEYNINSMSYTYEFNTEVLRHYRYSEGGWEIKLWLTAFQTGVTESKTYTTYKIIRFG